MTEYARSALSAEEALHRPRRPPAGAARPGPFGVDGVLAMQRGAGNQATASTLQRAVDDAGVEADAPAIEAGGDTDPAEEPTSEDPAEHRPFKASGGAAPAGEEQQPEGPG